MERDGHGNEGLKKRTSFQEGEDQLTAGYVDGGPDRRTEVEEGAVLERQLCSVCWGSERQGRHSAAHVDRAKAPVLNPLSLKWYHSMV